MSLEGCTGNSHACILDGPGFTAVPNIEANVAPAQGSAEGVFVVDGSIPYYGVGVITDPVTFGIEAGFVRSIEGGDQAALLDQLLAEQDDPWVYNVAQFAFGLNPDCTDFTGEMLNDEGVDGTVHLGVGSGGRSGGRHELTTTAPDSLAPQGRFTAGLSRLGCLVQGVAAGR
jgi:leucyl aminopeptidase (aminopeptidase T)